METEPSITRLGNLAYDGRWEIVVGKLRIQVDCDTFNLDNEIDRLLYCLWGLIDNEIAVVKSVTLGFLCLCHL